MKYRSAKILLILLIMFSSCAYYNTFFNAKKYFNDAENEREKRIEDLKKKEQDTEIDLNKPSPSELKNYNSSIEKASKVLELYPKSDYVDDALFLLGKCFYRKQDYSKAKRKFLELYENFPNSKFLLESQLWLGKTNIELRDYETAESNFHDILKAETESKVRDEAQFLLGGLFRHKKDYVTAISEYNNAAKRSRDKFIRANSYFEMGECYYQLKNYAKSVENFKLAKKYSPDDKFEFNASFRAGLSLMDMQQYDEAVKIFTNLLGDVSNEENWPLCRLEIANCHRLKSDFDLAVEWYNDLVEQHPKTEEAAKAYFYLGKIYQEQKAEYQFAKEFYDKAGTEFSRSEISDEARVKSRSLKEFQELQDDIEAQQHKIEIGDSIAASMDSLEVSTVTFGFEKKSLLDSLIADTTHFVIDSLFTSDSLRLILDSLKTVIGNDTAQIRQYLVGKRKEFLLTLNRKITLKSGELGTPKEELIKDKMLLAEIFLFEFNQPDSALKQYIDVLELDTSSTNLPKTLYAIGYICETFKSDTTLADSVFTRLITDYPNHPLAREVRKKKSFISGNDPEQEAERIFLLAEHTYVDRKNFTHAIDRFQTIRQDFPTTEYAPKSLMTMGWIYENKLNQQDKALEIYKELIDAYPNTSYAMSVKKKVSEVASAKSSSGTDKETQTAEKPTAGAEAPLNELAADAGKDVDVSRMDKPTYRRYLLTEMEKNDPRRTTLKRW